jgi:hypothetical protein
LAGDLLGEGRDEAFAIDGDAKGGVDALQKLRDVEWGASLFKYVIGHVNLGQTFLGSGLRCWGVRLAEAANGAKLGLQRGFKNGENGFFEIVVHGGILGMDHQQDASLRSVCQ